MQQNKHTQAQKQDKQVRMTFVKYINIIFAHSQTKTTDNTEP